ncbi:MAG: acyl-CoA dehydrogenase family protein [Desulfitobacteriaceae bacterium]|nr:acyl-CoA dehydrogenase family protein [Desulfitobacteriaceae bacterium]MDI6881154.1 acyl-CoA dehydrogenase family protein [Desulfitobacteriaceae bacterium]MDI6914450.1 acyl-CoA dehydrogenase family protein [Desulfitobacteriaceae bacterium]
MDFALSEEQKMLQEMARKFAEKEIIPTMEEDLKNHTFRPEIVKKMGDAGFLGCGLPEEYGGNGLGILDSVLIGEQLAKVNASWRLPLNMQNIGPALTVNAFGTKEQKADYLPGWVSGEKLGFFAITEPNSGSDVASMKTTATDKGDHWEINGSKMWISQAAYGDYGLLYAYTDREKKHKGMTCFIVNLKETEGIAVRDITTKMGLANAPTGEIFFDGAKIPKDSVLGNVGEGFKICMWQLNNTRISCAAGALGVGGAALEAAVNYANERTQFGQKLASFQMIKASIAEMAAEHHAAQLLVYRAAWLKDQGLPNQYETSIGKYFSAESAVHLANEAMKILGSYGYSSEYPAERYLRDAKSFQVVEGTSNIQKLIIADITLGESMNR